MHVASLELCKQLFELSGWEDTYLMWVSNMHPPRAVNADEYAKNTGKANGNPDVIMTETDFWIRQDELLPAYGLDYMLQKLPRYDISFNGVLHTVTFWDDDTDSQIFSEGDTVENAAAMLLIKLLKQGILKREASDA